jgi:hypothetical protein
MYCGQMQGLVIEPNGQSTVVHDVDEKVLSEILGAQHLREESKDGSAYVVVHELWKVADLPINVFASMFAGMIVGGTSVILPKNDTALTRSLFSAETKKKISESNQDAVLLARLQDLQEKNRTQRNFKWFEPDRWVFNGDTFDAIVVGEADDHLENGIPRYDVWFFADTTRDPFLLRIVEYSLAEVLEGMILGDEETSQGNPPEHFRAVLHHFGLQ